MRGWRSARWLGLLLGLVMTSAAVAADFDDLLTQANALRSNNPAAFAELLVQLEARCSEASDAQRWQFEYLKAYADGYSGRFEAAVERAGRIVREAPDPGVRVRAASLIVNGHAAGRHFEEGLRQLGPLLALLDEVEDPELRDHVLYSAASLYNQVGKVDLGMRYAESILAGEPAPRTRCFAEQLRLETALALDEIIVDEDQVAAVVAQCLGIGENIPANFARLHWARHRFDQGDHQPAATWLLAHLDEIDASGYARLIVEAHALLGEWRLAEGLSKEAARHARTVIERGDGLAHAQPVALAHRILSTLAEQADDPSLALMHYRQYALADKRYLDDVKARELAYQLVSHEALQQSQTIALLNKQNEVLNLEQAVARSSANSHRLLAALLAVLALSLGYWAFKTQRVQGALRRMAQTDALTGIGNRHHFSQRAEAVLHQEAKANQSVALVMFDLDSFKAINDLHGHPTGDWVLRTVAQVCLGFCRESDFLGRLGGEEFAILMAGRDETSAGRLAAQCRAAIADIDTSATGKRFKITASFGVADTQIAGYDLHTLLTRADQALYRAKQAGRDQVALHSRLTGN